MNPKPFVCACLLAASVPASAANAQGEAPARNAPSCGEWIVHREKSDTLALGNASWLLGYVAGLAVASGRDYLSGTDNSAIYKWMDNYCRANPLKDVGSGGNALAAELGKKKAAPK